MNNTILKKTTEDKKLQILKILPTDVKNIIKNEDLDFEKLQEIRLRMGQPLGILYQGKEALLPRKKPDKFIISEKEIRITMDYVSSFSIYAYEQELRQGYLTIEGGHRVGITGKAIMHNHCVRNLQYISSVNIRISHEILGCADKLFPYITYNRMLYHTLIISPPGCGKTTMLRDIIRQISDGNKWVPGNSVGVVDERSEIGSCYQGVPQNHLGKRTDILDCCPKAEGMIMLIRSMTPQVIAVDEIGGEEDIHAIEYTMHCGCKMVATAHGASMDEMRQKILFEKLIQERRFERYVVLGNVEHAGEIISIYDNRGNELWEQAPLH